MFAIPVAGVTASAGGGGGRREGVDGEEVEEEQLERMNLPRSFCYVHIGVRESEGRA